MIKLFDRVKVNIPTTGTGDIEFGAAASTAFLTPTEAGVLDGDEVRYVIVDGLDFEEGVGLIKDTVATMERTVTKSKIGGTVGTSALNLSGTAVLALTASAADIGGTSSGSNANGTWVKWANGIIEQWGPKATNFAGNATVTFPIPFSALHHVGVNVRDAPAAARVIVAQAYNTTASGCAIRAVYAASAAVSGVSVNTTWYAKGV